MSRIWFALYAGHSVLTTKENTLAEVDKFERVEWLRDNVDYKYRFVIEVEGNDKGFHGMLVDGPTQLQDVPVEKKMAVIYSMIHILADHVYELRNPADPEIELNTMITYFFDAMVKQIYEMLESMPGVVVSSSDEEVFTSKLAFILNDDAEQEGLYDKLME